MHDRGRGPELRSCRITVNDLFPYFESREFTDARLLELFPITQAELDALRDYIAEHREEVVEVNCRVDERNRRGTKAQDTPEARERSRRFLEEVRLYNDWSAAHPNDGTSVDPKPGERMAAFRKWLATQTLESAANP
jgi:hypothetical protein